MRPDEEILNNIPNSGFYHFDPDTIASSTSLDSYLMAVGGSVDSVLHSINHKSKKQKQKREFPNSIKKGVYLNPFLNIYYFLS